MTTVESTDNAPRRGAGRPPLDGTPFAAGVRSPRVNVAIGQSLEDRLTAHAEATGEGRSQIVRAALHAYLPELDAPHVPTEDHSHHD